VWGKKLCIYIFFTCLFNVNQNLIPSPPLFSINFPHTRIFFFFDLFTLMCIVSLLKPRSTRLTRLSIIINYVYYIWAILVIIIINYQSFQSKWKKVYIEDSIEKKNLLPLMTYICKKEQTRSFVRIWEIKKFPPTISLFLKSKFYRLIYFLFFFPLKKKKKKKIKTFYSFKILFIFISNYPLHFSTFTYTQCSLKELKNISNSFMKTPTLLKKMLDSLERCLYIYYTYIKKFLVDSFFFRRFVKFLLLLILSPYHFFRP